MGVLGLAIGLVLVLIGGVIAVGAIGGWFDDGKMELSPEYVNVAEPGLVELGVEEYGALVESGKSFVVFVDQGGCTTADRLETFVTNWAKDRGAQVYKIMFEEMKQTVLHEAVKYYPSVALVFKGKPVAWLRADADEDAEAYNDEEAFKGWMGRYVE